MDLEIVSLMNWDNYELSHFLLVVLSLRISELCISGDLSICNCGAYQRYYIEKVNVLFYIWMSEYWF